MTPQPIAIIILLGLLVLGIIMSWWRERRLSKIYRSLLEDHRVLRHKLQGQVKHWEKEAWQAKDRRDEANAQWWEMEQALRTSKKFHKDARKKFHRILKKKGAEIAELRRLLEVANMGRYPGTEVWPNNKPIKEVIYKRKGETEKTIRQGCKEYPEHMKQLNERLEKAGG